MQHYKGPWVAFSGGRSVLINLNQAFAVFSVQQQREIYQVYLWSLIKLAKKCWNTSPTSISWPYELTSQGVVFLTPCSHCSPYSGDVNIGCSFSFFVLSVVLPLHSLCGLCWLKSKQTQLYPWPAVRKRQQHLSTKAVICFPQLLWLSVSPGQLSTC